MTAIGTGSYGYQQFAGQGFMVNPFILAEDDPSILEMPDAVAPVYLQNREDFQNNGRNDAANGADNARGGGANRPNAETRTETRTVEKDVTHTVAKGESLSKIGAKYGVAWKEIYEANKDIIDNPDLIRPGWELKIPGQTETVEEEVEVPVEAQANGNRANAAPTAGADVGEADQTGTAAPVEELEQQDEAQDQARGGGAQEPAPSTLTFEERLERMPENQRPSMDAIMYVMDNPQSLQKAYNMHSQRSQLFTQIAGDARYNEQQRVLAAQIARVAQAKMYNLEVFYKNISWLVEGIAISQAQDGANAAS